MTAGQTSFPVAPSIFKFAQHGQSGAWVSELLPHTAKVADDLCFIKSMHTEAINHDPAVTFFQTGFQLAGRPSIGAWITYGLGSENQDLPAFVVMISQGNGGQPLADRLWGSGFLPSRYQGVKFRSVGDPVLYLSNPPGFDRRSGARFLDDLAKLNQLEFEVTNNPEIATRIAQYEMAFRMQTSVPELTDLSKEPGTPSSCTAPMRASPARSPRTACWRGGWPSAACASSSSIIAAGTSTPTCRRPSGRQCLQTDQPCAALIQDLKERGLLDDTLVIWGGEFGRTVYCQGKLTADDYGRDHHPRCFTIWMAGGGIKPGITSAKPTTTATTSRRTRCTSTTCTPRSCTAWASITRG